MGAFPPGRMVATRSRPASREMRSARSASRVLVEELELVDEVCVWWVCGGAWPLWPSLMAVVDRADREVVPELGVPLWRWGN